jgi:putative inorganic carbon (hco3(-)) transporter
MLFYGLLLLFFLQIVRPQDFVPGLEGVRLVLYLMTILLIALLFSPVKKKLIRSPQDKFAAMFFVAIILSTLTLFWISNVIDTSIYVLKLGSIYYFIAIVVDSEVKLERAIWAMIVFMAIVGFLGVLHYHGFNIPGYHVAWAQDRQAWRLYGVGMFDNPNDIAYSMVLIVPFALGLLIQARNFASRISSLILLIISLYTIYLTGSRGGQVALAAGLFAWAYFWIKSRKRRKQIVILAVLGVLAVISAKATGYREDKSAMGRVEAWSEGWQMLKSHPIIGVGKDQFIEHHSLDSHSSYVRAGAELGLIGLYAFVGMIYSAYTVIIRILKSPENKRWRPYFAGFGGFFVSYILASGFSTRTYDNVFLMCVALVGVLGRFSLRNSGEVSAEGVLFPSETARLWDKNVFGLTIAILIAWYLFLRQVY